MNKGEIINRMIRKGSEKETEQNQKLASYREPIKICIEFIGELNSNDRCKYCGCQEWQHPVF